MKILPFAIAAVVLVPPAAEARASEWGCEVLLCSASDNPSWWSVATCRAPMEKLISAMKRPSFSWPTCPEGGAGKPGFERYSGCPAGWVPATPPASSGSWDNELSQCSRTVRSCNGQSDGFGQNLIERREGGVTVIEEGCELREYRARPLREKPYYFDIQSSTGGSPARHYFSLDR